MPRGIEVRAARSVSSSPRESDGALPDAFGRWVAYLVLEGGRILSV